MKKLLPCISFLLAGISMLNSQDILTGLVAHYPLDGNTLDLSGNDLHGIANGITTTTDRFGLPNTAMSFNGLDNYILIAHSEILNFGTSPFAISLWLKADEPVGAPQMLLQKGASGIGPQFWLRVNDYDNVSRLKGAVTDGNPPGTSVASPLPLFNDKIWHHVIFQRTFTQLELWVDGQLVAQLPDTQFRDVSSEEPLIIGAQNPWPVGGNFPFIHNHYAGSLDEIRLYNRSLSKDDILTVSNTYCPDTYLLDMAPIFGLYQAAEELYTSGTIQVNKNTIFKSGNFVRLSPGFTVPAGAQFTAKIEECISTEVLESSIDLSESTTHQNWPVASTSTALSLAVIPNPFRSEMKVTINLENPVKASLRLFDMQGRKIQQVFINQLLVQNKCDYYLTASDLAPGMYFLHLQTENKLLVKKIVKID